ncbi:hypothetical protein CHELA41_21434 [Hyphomicrobiales bacterium]|nr:hypothetical protein CHELA41_21434 [Hyphomicrobiales bacterium]
MALAERNVGFDTIVPGFPVTKRKKGWVRARKFAIVQWGMRISASY